MIRPRSLLVFVLVAAQAPTGVRADQFSGSRSITWDSIRDDTRAFFSQLFLGGYDADRDGEIEPFERASSPVFRSAVAGAILVGLACGLLGAFVTLRGMALFGDMIGHSVLPGITLGYVAAGGSKSTPAMLAGALVFGLLAAWFTRIVKSYSRVKEDAAIGIVLSVFYALGIWMMSWITRDPRLSAESSGLGSYLFGNAAVVETDDLVWLGAAALAVCVTIAMGYKELLVCTFDPQFATSIGVSRRRVDAVILVLLTCVIVVSIKILGVVLVAALLTIPPAAAYLLTDRFSTYCATSVAFASGAGFLGVWASSIFHIGVGPTIVCVAFALLGLSFAFAPRHGLLVRWAASRSHALRTQRENLLADAYRAREKRSLASGPIPLEDLALERAETIDVTRLRVRRLLRASEGSADERHLTLSPEGEELARRVVRSHRLWELFLAQEASLPADHVHPNAEELEHLLDPSVLEELERHLEHPETDPHGQTIPRS